MRIISGLYRGNLGSYRDPIADIQGLYRGYIA